MPAGCDHLLTRVCTETDRLAAAGKVYDYVHQKSKSNFCLTFATVDIVLLSCYAKNWFSRQGPVAYP
jgi:hypothetical protein